MSSSPPPTHTHLALLLLLPFCCCCVVRSIPGSLDSLCCSSGTLSCCWIACLRAATVAPSSTWVVWVFLYACVRWCWQCFRAANALQRSSDELASPSDADTKSSNKQQQQHNSSHARSHFHSAHRDLLQAVPGAQPDNHLPTLLLLQLPPTRLLLPTLLLLLPPPGGGGCVAAAAALSAQSVDALAPGVLLLADTSRVAVRHTPWQRRRQAGSIQAG